MILICFFLLFIAKGKGKKKDNSMWFFSSSYYPSFKEILE